MRQNEGIGPMQANTGGTFTTQASDEFTVGEEMTTWAGHLVRVTDKQPTNRFGSWKYHYTFEVISPKVPRAK